MRNLYEKNLILFTYIGEERKGLFTGIVKDCKLVYNNKISILKIKVVGFSVLLDIEKNTRIFQDEELTYREILSYVMPDTLGKVVFNKEDIKVDKLLFQYNETDWQFMKRISGMGESILIPLFHENGVRLSYGLPRSAKEIELQEDFYASGNRINDKSKDYDIEGIYHMFYSDEDYELGTVVKNRGLRFIICEKEAQTIEATLWSSKRLKTGIQYLPVDSIQTSEQELSRSHCLKRWISLLKLVKRLFWEEDRMPLVVLMIVATRKVL